MKKMILFAVLVGSLLMTCTNKEVKQTTDKSMEQTLNLTPEWDKVFPLSEKVNHKKVTFETQYGITLAADLYEPKMPMASCPPLLLAAHSEPPRSSRADSMRCGWQNVAS